MAKSNFDGSWKITNMDQRDEDFVDLVVPGFVRTEGDSGEFAFGAVAGDMHCIIGQRDGGPVVEWTWVGHDEGDEASGRGWARVDGKKLIGHLFFHDGDDSAFEATRSRARLDGRR